MKIHACHWTVNAALLVTVTLFVGVSLCPRYVIGSQENVDQALIAEAVTGNASSVQMIDNYRAIVRLDSKANVMGKDYLPIVQTAEYWRRGDDYRIRARDNIGRTVEVDRIKGVVRVIAFLSTDSESNPKSGPSLMLGDRNRRTIDMDPWELSLLSLPVGVYSRPPKPIYDVDSLVKSGEVQKAIWVQLQGRRAAHLKVALPRERRVYEVWLSPGYNWAAVRAIHRIYDEQGAEECVHDYACEDFIEPAPSIFVPTTTRIRTKYANSTYEAVAKITEIAVNESGPRQPAFTIPERGITAMDEASGTLNRVGSNGRPVGGVRSIAGTYSPPSNPGSTPGRYRSILGWSAVSASVVLLTIGWRLRPGWG